MALKLGKSLPIIVARAIRRDHLAELAGCKPARDSTTRSAVAVFRKGQWR